MAADNSEAVILEPGLIARSYVGTWFFLDLISSVPVDCYTMYYTYCYTQVPLDYIFLVFDWIRGATLYVNITLHYTTLHYTTNG